MISSIAALSALIKRIDTAKQAKRKKVDYR